MDKVIQKVNHQILDKIENYLQELSYRINYIPYTYYILGSEKEVEIFLNSDFFKLFWIIRENLRANIQYLKTIIIDYDNLGFPVIQRNLRVSVEAFYDLYNLSKESDYQYVLKYNSILNKEDYILDKKMIDYIETNFCSTKKNSISISQKANYAKKLGLDTELFEYLKRIGTNANSGSHPVIYTDLEVNKSIYLKKLLIADCKIFALSLESAITIINKEYKTTSPTEADESLQKITKEINESELFFNDYLITDDILRKITEYALVDSFFKNSSI